MDSEDLAFLKRSLVLCVNANRFLPNAGAEIDAGLWPEGLKLTTTTDAKLLRTGIWQTQ